MPKTSINEKVKPLEESTDKLNQHNPESTKHMNKKSIVVKSFHTIHEGDYEDDDNQLSR
jgi:hypothetical protein